MCLRWIDDVLMAIGVMSPFHQLSETLKRFITGMKPPHTVKVTPSWYLATFLTIAGISLHVEGLQRSSFNDNCVLLTFTHASNLDGFIISSTCPIRHFALAKKELFAIPFFSWIALAIGGVPVDRNNRKRAVKVLQRTVSLARNSKIAMAIAPEGTRSPTGQLLPFKKGTFHMWEDTRAPIVPVVILGAYDLYPVTNSINLPGKVWVRYLPPIYAKEARDRDDMLRLVRRRMLESLMKAPEDLGGQLTWLERTASFVGGCAMIGACSGLLWSIHRVLFLDLKLTFLSASLWTAGLSTGVTAVLYVYNVYIVNMF